MGLDFAYIYAYMYILIYQLWPTHYYYPYSLDSALGAKRITLWRARYISIRLKKPLARSVFIRQKKNKISQSILMSHRRVLALFGRRVYIVSVVVYTAVRLAFFTYEVCALLLTSERRVYGGTRRTRLCKTLCVVCIPTFFFSKRI